MLFVKKYKLIDKNGNQYFSDTPGTLGGHKKLKIYGRLDCPSALRYIAKGQYVQNRVFFADEETAIAAGYRPCYYCMRENYNIWKKHKMISLELGKGNVMLIISVNREKQIIDDKGLTSFWSDNIYLDEEGKEMYLENCGAKVFGRYVVCWAYIAQGQGGIVFVWDTESKSVVHFSNGNFAEKAELHDNKVYVLRYVSYWGVKAHFELDCCEFGVKSESNESASVNFTIQLSDNEPFSFDKYCFVYNEDDSVVVREKNKIQATKA